jgi:O-antigen ligase
LGGALFISALVGQWRVGLHPAGWHIQATDFRHLWEISAFDDALPLMTLLEALPTTLLGLLFINMRAETDTDSSERFPRENIAGWVIAGGVLVALEVLGQMAGGWHLGNDPMSFGGPFENRNTTAPLLAIFGACALVFFQSNVSAESRTNRTEARHWTVLLLALLLMGVAVACGSRNAVCVVFVTLFLWILCGWRHSAGWARLRWRMAAGILGLGVCVLFLRPQTKVESLQFEALSRSADSLRAARESDWAAATGDRAGMYAAAWRMYADYPATGAGLGTVPMVLWNNGPYKESITAFDKGLHVSHVHSMPLQLLAESGLLAMLSWLAIFILLPVVWMLRCKNSGVWAIPLAAMGVANLFDAVWLATGVPFLAVMLLAFILFAKQR